MANGALIPIFTIVLDPMERIYAVGERIQGYVLTNFKNDITFTKMVVTCKGEDQSFTDFHGLQMTFTHPALAIEEIIDVKKKNWEAGEHKFNFSFSLPLDIPSTWMAIPGSEDALNITYHIEASIEDFQINTSLEVSTLKVKIPFWVKEKHLPTPFEDFLMTGELQMKHFVRNSKLSCLSNPKLVQITAEQRKNVYTFGDVITLNLGMRNDSRKKFVLSYGINRNYHNVRNNESVDESSEPRIFQTPSWIPQSGNVSIRMDIAISTKDFPRFLLQPSQQKSTQTQVKDSVYIRLVEEKERENKIISEMRLPIYVYSSGMENTNHNGQQCTLIDVLFKNKEGELPTYMLPCVGKVEVKKDITDANRDEAASNVEEILAELRTAFN